MIVPPFEIYSGVPVSEVPLEYSGNRRAIPMHIKHVLGFQACIQPAVTVESRYRTGKKTNPDLSGRPYIQKDR